MFTAGLSDLEMPAQNVWEMFQNTNSEAVYAEMKTNHYEQSFGAKRWTNISVSMFDCHLKAKNCQICDDCIKKNAKNVEPKKCEEDVLGRPAYTFDPNYGNIGFEKFVILTAKDALKKCIVGKNTPEKCYSNDSPKLLAIRPIKKCEKPACKLSMKALTGKSGL